MREFPLEFEKNMREMLGEEAEDFFLALQNPPALALRWNPLRGGEERAAQFGTDPVPWEPLGRYLTREKPGNSIEHFAGALYLQEASAMAPARALHPEPGDRVLDLCAAPGGKSGQIAAMLEGRGVLVSNEIDRSRAGVLAGNLERLGARNAVVCSEHPGLLAEKWPETFDKILVDAPCSGEGMFRRDAGAVDAWSAQAPEGCARRQREILESAASMLRPGGRLAYSTCTYNARENEGVVEEFLKAHPEFAPEEFSLPGIGEAREGMLRLWPHRLRGDGQFVFCAKKRGEARGSRQSALRPRDCARALDALGEEIALPDFLRGRSLLLRGKRLYALPAETPPLEGIRVVAPGLAVLRMEKNRVEPEHALAMALDLERTRCAPLSGEQAARYLSGEEMEISGEAGWRLVTCRDLPLGWGKLAAGRLKNHLPKGLRKQTRFWECE